jgi:SPP1 gp7 family putative phage head morphogenesis protein
MAEQKISGKNTDSNLKSPTEQFAFFRKNQFWKRTLTNNDFLVLYKRGGGAYKAANKVTNDIFDRAFKTNNSQFQNAIENYNLHGVNRYAYKNAWVSGSSLIFIGYKDGEDYSKPANTNSQITSFYVIPRAWVAQDKYHDGKVEDFYKIYEASGQTFQVHESRLIRFTRDETALSALEPAYNPLFVTDNILWSVGQTIWRVGQGFPHITIKDPEIIDGENEVETLKKTGVLRDINSESGFISDERYGFEFKGAGGVAIKPKEYYDVALTEASMALEIPKQIMEGTNAGAVTGPETNLRDYYSDISSKQVGEAQPLYVLQAELLGITVKHEDFEWQPLFEQTGAEIADNLLKEVQSYEKLIVQGVLTSEQVFDILKNDYPELNLETFEEPEKKNSPPFLNQTDANSLLNQQTTGSFPKAELKKNIDFGTQDPAWVKLEKKYFKEMKKKFLATKEIITGVLVGFNTDAVTETTFKPITTRLGKIFANEKTVYKDIINRNIDSSFVQGAEAAAKKLNISASLIDFKKGEKAKKILQGNATEITNSLLTDIEKEVGLLLTDISLNNIPISNAAFKKEIQNIFDKKIGRLESGVVTETTRSRNQGLEFGFKESGLVTHKIWVSVLDDRTTEICTHLNGEIAEIGKPFSTGDFNAPAHVNCRSSIEPITLSETELNQFKT